MTRVAMFEHYVQVQAGNPRWRRATSVSAVVSGGITIGLLGALWLNEKLTVDRVDPPAQAVHVVQMMMEEEGTPPPPPPAPPAAAASAEAPATASTETPSIPDEVAPLEQPQDTNVVAARIAARPSTPTGPVRGIPGGVPRGVPGGIPGGDPLHGIPGGIGLPGVPGVIGGTGIPGGIATRRPATAPEAVAKEPLHTVKRNALFAPDCDAKKLAATQAAMFRRRGGHTKIAFCVDETGKVVDVRTTQKFPGDPEVDRICRETVTRWRFRPFQVGGKAKKTCSSVDFAIEFE